MKSWWIRCNSLAWLARFGTTLSSLLVLLYLRRNRNLPNSALRTRCWKIKSSKRLYLGDNNRYVYCWWRGYFCLFQSKKFFSDFFSFNTCEFLVHPLHVMSQSLYKIDGEWIFQQQNQRKAQDRRRNKNQKRNPSTQSASGNNRRRWRKRLPLPSYNINATSELLRNTILLSWSVGGVTVLLKSYPIQLIKNNFVAQTGLGHCWNNAANNHGSLICRWV